MQTEMHQPQVSINEQYALGAAIRSFCGVRGQSQCVFKSTTSAKIFNYKMYSKLHLPTKERLSR